MNAIKIQTYDNALAALKSRLPSGEASEAALLDTVSKMVIRDKLVAPKMMHFHVQDEGAKLRLGYGMQRDGELLHLEDTLSIHPHALGQLAARAGIPMTYVSSLNSTPEWKVLLLAYNLNELFHKPDLQARRPNESPPRFLHRIVDGELRGFLSRRYNRHLASAPLLRAFSDVCKKVGAKPVEATSSPVRFALKCLLPMVFEAYPGEYVAFGVEWANSDFGAGKQTVSQTVWRVASGTSAVIDEGISRVHLGSIIEDSDIEMSEETARKEVAAHQSAIVDTVTAQLAEKTIERMLNAVRAAHEQKIPWTKLKGQLARVLSKADVNWMQNVLDDKGETIIDLPAISFDGSERVPNAYWASSCIALIASRTEDKEKKLELQREAGRLFTPALKEAS